MPIGLLSDTHGNLSLMHAAAEQLAGRLSAEVLVHLGDDFEDGEELSVWGLPVLRVPGLYCPAYHDEDVPRVLFKEVEGRSVAFVHREEDLSPEERGACSVLAVGHTHRYVFRSESQPLVVNPGHLKASIHRGQPPSFGLLEVTGTGMRFTVHGLGGEVLLEGERRWRDDGEVKSQIPNPNLQ